MERWCADRGLAPLPGDPAAVCAYLAERAENGITVATLNVACSAIGYVHRGHGTDNPAAHHSVRQVRLGLRRTYGIAPRRQVRPLAVTELRQILARIDRTRPIGLRDTPRSSCSATPAPCAAPSWWTWCSPTSNTRPPACCSPCAGPRPTRKDAAKWSASPTAATPPPTRSTLDAWLALRGHEPGPLFTRVSYSRIREDPIGGNTITRMLHTRAKAAGLPAERITAHSLRAGHTTTAALAGVGPDRIGAQTQHRDIAVLVERYIRPLPCGPAALARAVHRARPA